MLGNLKIGKRLAILVGVLSVLLLGVGVTGIVGMSSTKERLRTVYEDRTVALQKLNTVLDYTYRNRGRIDAAFYAHRQRPADEVFPWDHLDLGVTKAYLREEFEASLVLGETEHCQTGKCGDCGVGAKTCVEIKGLTGYFPKYTKIVEKMRERGTLTLNGNGV